MGFCKNPGSLQRSSAVPVRFQTSG